MRYGYAINTGEKMMWALAIKSKLTAAVLLCAVMGVMMVTNFGTRNNSEKINSAVASIYEDRLVVEGYIFDYAQALQQIEEATEGTASPAGKHALITEQINDMNRLNALYAKTRLTRSESDNFNRFTALCGTIAKRSAMGDLQGVRAAAQEADGILAALSAIQMSEARAQMDSVKQMSSFGNILSQLELVVLIVVAVLVQVLVFSSRTLAKAKMPDNVHWN